MPMDRLAVSFPPASAGVARGLGLRPVAAALALLGANSLGLAANIGPGAISGPVTVQGGDTVLPATNLTAPAASRVLQLNQATPGLGGIVTVGAAGSAITVSATSANALGETGGCGSNYSRPNGYDLRISNAQITTTLAAAVTCSNVLDLRGSAGGTTLTVDQSSFTSIKEILQNLSACLVAVSHRWHPPHP